MRLRIDRNAILVLFQHLAKQRIYRRNRIDLVAPKLDPVRLILIARIKLYDVAANSKCAALEIDVHPFVLQLDEPLQKLVALHLHSRLNEHQHPVICVRVAESVYARDRCNHDHIVPLKKRTRRAQAKTVDLVVDRRFFLYVEIGGRDVCFRLVIVVIRDKILDRVLRKKSFEFLIKLCRECLVMSKDERRPLHLFDHVRDRKGLSAAGNAEQNLVFGTIIEALNEMFYCRRLVALGLIFRNETKLHTLIIQQNADDRKAAISHWKERPSSEFSAKSMLRQRPRSRPDPLAFLLLHPKMAHRSAP